MSHYFYSRFLPYFYFKSLKHVCVRGRETSGQTDRQILKGSYPVYAQALCYQRKKEEGGEERQRRGLRVFVLASIEAKSPPPTPWGLPPRRGSSWACPLRWRPIHTSLPDAASLEFSFFHLHTHPFHHKLSHWQSPKENKCNVSGN